MLVFGAERVLNDEHALNSKKCYSFTVVEIAFTFTYGKIEHKIYKV